MFHCVGGPQFNHSPTEGCFICFQFYVIMNKANINTCVQILCEPKVSLFWYKCLRVQLTGSLYYVHT